MQSRFLHYRDTTYIYGTRLDFFVWLDSGHVKTWQKHGASHSQQRSTRNARSIDCKDALARAH